MINGAGDTDGRTTTSISPTRRASSRRRSGRCRRGEGDIEWHDAPAASLGRGRLLQPDSDRHPRAHRRSDRRTSIWTTTAASTTSRSGRGASSCARSGAAPRCRRSGSAATRIPGVAGTVAQLLGRLRPGELLHHPPTRLQVAGRLGRTDVPALRHRPPRTSRAARHRVDEQSVAVNAYLRGHRVKLQVDYTPPARRDATPAARTPRTCTACAPPSSSVSDRVNSEGRGAGVAPVSDSSKITTIAQEIAG